MKEILLVGATGYTGAITLDCLARRNLSCTVVGRDTNKLQCIQETYSNVKGIRVACAEDPLSLERAFEKADIVINTVGPFHQFGISVLSASLNVGAHYIDCSAEQVFQKKVLEDYHQQATQKGLTVLSGHGCDFAFSYLGAAILEKELGPLTQCASYHELVGFKPSRGTAKSALGMLKEGHYTYRNRNWVQERPSLLPTRVRLAGDREKSHVVPFPGGDTILIPNEIKSIADYSAYLIFPQKEAKGFSVLNSLRPIFSRILTKRVIRFFEKQIDAKLEDPSLHKRQNVPWRVLVQAKSDHSSGTVDMRGFDPYGISGEILATAADWLARGRARSSGVISTGVAFAPKEFLESLASNHVSWILRKETKS